MSEPSHRQLVFVRALKIRLRLTDALLDSHCLSRFGAPFAALERRQVSDLLDEITTWEAIPSQLLREAGQLDLPGMEALL